MFVPSYHFSLPNTLVAHLSEQDDGIPHTRHCSTLSTNGSRCLSIMPVLACMGFLQYGWLPAKKDSTILRVH